MMKFAKSFRRKSTPSSSKGEGAYLRAQASLAILEVIDNGCSLRKVLKEKQQKFDNDKDRALFKEICFGTIRWYYQLESIANQILNEPLPTKHHDIKYLICCGIYQIQDMRIPEYAAVNETVNATKLLNKPWAIKLVNRILRGYLRKQKSYSKKFKTEQAEFAHPQWLIDIIKTDWPEHWQKILNANNTKPPFALRINRIKTSATDYAALLETENISTTRQPDFPDALIVDDPMATTKLPGYKEGLFSVQDLSGQKVVELLDLKEGDTLLDACAAPGSKTCHIVEAQPKLKKLVAIDIDAERLLRVRENLTRLQLPIDSLKMVLDDASHTKQWWDGEQFDHILLDAPCSAIGVIRRHPDIKLLRRHEDINKQAQLQHLLLKTLWPLLKPEGKLLYTTCSVLRDENDKMIHQFLNETKSAKEQKLSIPGCINLKHGCQFLPSEQNGPDGFYYCLLKKAK